MTHSATLLILDALAVFRLTRLVITDTILASVRQRLLGSRPGITMDQGVHAQRIMVASRPRLAEFLGCPWCVSIYAAVLVTACQALAPAIWLYPSAVLAFSAVAGLLSERS